MSCWRVLLISSDSTFSRKGVATSLFFVTYCRILFFAFNFAI